MVSVPSSCSGLASIEDDLDSFKLSPSPPFYQWAALLCAKGFGFHAQ